MDQKRLALGKDIGATVREFVQRQLEPLHKRLAELETREQNFKYVGTWQAAAGYKRGNFATLDGSLWHCNHETSARPGTNGDWSLACKRGKDAR